MTTTMEWAAAGFVELPPICAGDRWDRLEREAHELRPTARLEQQSTISTARDGSFRSGAHFRNSGGGTELRSLLQSRELLAQLRTATAIPNLVPVRCSYNYYETGDFIGIHRDALRCRLTVTFALVEDVQAMAWEPQLRSADNDTVAKYVLERGCTPAVGEELTVSYRGMRAFDGYNIPHWRRPYPGALGIVANLCYFDL